MTKKKAKPVANPFKVKKSKASGKGKAKDRLDPEDDVIREAVDAYVKAAVDEKAAKTAKDGAKKKIEKGFGHQKYAERCIEGNKDSFYIEGAEQEVLYQLQASSSLNSQDELDELAETREDPALAEDENPFFVEDYSTIRLQGEYLAANFDRIVGKLQKALGDEFSEVFTTEVGYKYRPDIIDQAVEYAADAEDLAELFGQLKMKRFIKK